MSTTPAASRMQPRSNSSSSPSSGRCCTPVATSDPRRLGGRPRLSTDGCPLAGPGAPLVDQFAPASFAAALGITLDAAQAADRRRPRAHLPTPPPLGLVVAGLVPVWLARAISRETHDLSVEAVAFADRLISATPDKVRLVNAARLVDEARLYFDPDRAVEDERQRAGRSAASGSGTAATGHHRRVDDPGHPRRRCSSTRPSAASPPSSAPSATPTPSTSAEPRAVGILADPQHALDLLSGHRRRARQPAPVAVR